MKKLILVFAALACALGVQAQTLTTQTTLGGAVADPRVGTILVASATGFVFNGVAYVDKEAMRITAVNGTLISVVRGAMGTPATPHNSGATVWTGPPSVFTSADTTVYAGPCVAAATYLPTFNTRTGDAYYCISGTWMRNPYATYVGTSFSTAVASAAGVITPSGPLFHITGTSAITGFTLPGGFTSGSFCVVPDGTFTTTNAGNIAIASTAVVSRLICWSYDPATTKFYPTY